MKLDKNILNNNNKIICILDDLNGLFKNADATITEMLKQQNINTRRRVLNFKDVLVYKFGYALKHKTQKNIINDYKYDHNIECENSAFYKKEQKIPLKYYEDIYEKVLAIFNKYTFHVNYNILTVDGVCNNTNYNGDGKLETSLNMGYFDATHGIPIEIDPIGNEKNHEIKCLINAINNKTIKTENNIFVCDRGYFSYDLMNFLNEKNIKFVIRIKNNSTRINDNKKQNVKKHIPNNIRTVNYSFNKESLRELTNKTTKQTDMYKVTQKVSCNIMTNLDATYNDESIKKIYNSRWNIEEYFKFIKSNFKFANMIEHNKHTLETYKKTFVVIKIYSILEKIFELICDEIVKNNHKKYTIKINKSELVNGLSKIIPDIIFSKLTHENMLFFLKTYINFSYTKKDTHNPRVSKTPFTKWYVKDYHNKYDIETMFDAYTSDEPDKINKNLKSRLKNITFEKIDNMT